MAQSSDLEFGKLALIFGFASKENIYAAIRETALLQELGIPKRLAHVIYERNYLNEIQVQSLLWALYSSHKINRFPPRVVYAFTDEDDRRFLEKALATGETAATETKSHGKTQASPLSQSKIYQAAFPQDELIYCIELQKQLQQKGFPRSLLSILNAKGYLQDNARKLVPDIEQKKVVVATPEAAKSKPNIRRWEATLFAAIAVQKHKLSQEAAQKAQEIWTKLLEHKIALRYSEVLHYLGPLSKGDLTKLSIFLSEIAHIDQIPRFNLFDLGEEERTYIRTQLIADAGYKKAYQECSQLAEKFKELGITIPPEELMIHRGQLERSALAGIAKKQSAAAQDGPMATQYHALFPKNLPVPAETPKLTRRVKKDLATKMIPFSVGDVEKEFASQYLEERKSVRTQQKPKGDITSIIQELSQTQMVSFQEIDMPDQDMPLQGTKALQFRQSSIQPIAPKTKPAKDKMPDHTEYFALDADISSKKADTPKAAGAKPAPNALEPAFEQALISEPPTTSGIEQTCYIALNATPEEIRELGQKVATMGKSDKPLKRVLAALFVVGAGIAIIEPKFQELFAKPDAIFHTMCGLMLKLFPFMGDTLAQANHLPIYTALSMFIVYLPALFVGDWFGKLADRGHVNRLYLWGFIIYAMALPPMAFFSDILYHAVLRFIQGIGLAAIFVASEFCISRWYGSLERGKIMGFAMIAFTIGFCLGFELPIVCDELVADLGLPLSSLAVASIFWAVVSLLAIPVVLKIAIAKAVSEDAEEDLGNVVIPKKPLIAATLYGVLEVAFFAVFFPYYPDEVPLWGSVQTETLIALFGIGVILSSYVLGWLGDQIGPVPILTSLALAAVICFCALPLASAATAKLMFFLIGIVIGGLCPLGFSWMLEVLDNERYFGAASGAFAMYEGAGAMMGCVLCGVVFMLWGASGFFLLLSMIFVAYFYLLITSQRRESYVGGDERKVRGLLSLLGPAE